MDVPVYNMQGAEVGKMSIDENTLAASYSDDGLNPALIKQAYVMYHANRRQGTVGTLSRAVVSGSTKKMYKQKGTGRARHSTKKAPQFRGGGRAFAKDTSRESFVQDMPRKMRRKANRNALLSKIIGSEGFGSEGSGAAGFVSSTMLSGSAAASRASATAARASWAIVSASAAASALPARFASSA